VAPPTADDRDNDIVELGLAILDEVLGSWGKSRHQGHASRPLGALDPNAQSRATS
jgi:hypothetical protein